MADIDREDHTALALNIDDYPVIPDPEPELPRERSRHRLQKVSWIVNLLDLPQLADHTHLDAAIEPGQRLLSARSELNAPARYLSFSFFRCVPQALTALRRETAGPWPPAATSVNICRSAYSPFLPMLNERTGRK